MLVQNIKNHQNISNIYFIIFFPVSELHLMMYFRSQKEEILTCFLPDLFTWQHTELHLVSSKNHS